MPTKQLTKKQERAYLKARGGMCPCCKSGNITVLSHDSDDDWYTQNVMCQDCLAEWTELYGLKGILDLQVSFPDERKDQSDAAVSDHDEAAR